MDQNAARSPSAANRRRRERLFEEEFTPFEEDEFPEELEEEYQGEPAEGEELEEEIEEEAEEEEEEEHEPGAGGYGAEEELYGEE